VTCGAKCATQKQNGDYLCSLPQLHALDCMHPAR
jgi:hypothetical protein